MLSHERVTPELVLVDPDLQERERVRLKARAPSSENPPRSGEGSSASGLVDRGPPERGEVLRDGEPSRKRAFRVLRGGGMVDRQARDEGAAIRRTRRSQAAFGSERHEALWWSLHEPCEGPRRRSLLGYWLVTLVLVGLAVIFFAGASVLMQQLAP